MRFVKEQVDLNPIVDTVFAIVSKAKEAKKELGEDKVVDATIGSLYNEEGKIVAFDSVFNTLKQLLMQEALPAIRTIVNMFMTGL